MEDTVTLISEPTEIVECIDLGGTEIIQTFDERIEVVEISEQGPCGPSAAASLIVGETPAGNVDGVNATFTTALPFVPESVEIFVNGLKQKLIDEFNTVGSQTVSLAVSPGIGETILINYVRE